MLWINGGAFLIRRLPFRDSQELGQAAKKRMAIEALRAGGLRNPDRSVEVGVSLKRWTGAV